MSNIIENKKTITDGAKEVINVIGNSLSALPLLLLKRIYHI
jgi:hypothetical protein